MFAVLRNFLGCFIDCHSWPVAGDVAKARAVQRTMLRSLFSVRFAAATYPRPSTVLRPPSVSVSRGDRASQRTREQGEAGGLIRGFGFERPVVSGFRAEESGMGFHLQAALAAAQQCVCVFVACSARHCYTWSSPWSLNLSRF